MYFITKKTSVTGKKFADLENRFKECKKAQIELADKYGFQEWRNGYWCAFGGISSCIFNENPNEKIWKNVMKSKVEWMPKERTKEGRKIKQEMNKLPRLHFEDVNSVIGYKNDMNLIGINFSGKEYFGFSFPESYDVTLPADCEEVTRINYLALMATA